ncbi:MAG TPA: DUF5063 domain-containing protein [Gaiellaceae bacterium]|nr:DUF5063 domain-containing protein [Gaiellaceae bacterium]
MHAARDDLVSAYLEAARAFRSALVNDEAEQHEFARRLRNAVARLYLTASSLPRVGRPTTEARVVATVSPAHDAALERRVRARLGDGDTLEEERRGSLAYRLVEIDAELARCVDSLGEPCQPDALPAAWSAFEECWGSHALDVLRPLHRIARA